MRALPWIVLVGCAFHAGAASNGGDAGSRGSGDGSGVRSAKRRVKLTFQNGMRSEALVELAALVVLDPTRIDYSDCQASGADLRFFDADDTTPLAYEIEAWNPGARSLVWVNVPRIDAASDADFIYMHYGDPSLADAQDPPAVWTSHAQGIYHMSQDPGPGGLDDMRDSSQAANHGTASAAMTSADRVDAAIGKGLRLEGNQTGVTASAIALGTYTWAMWLDGDAAPVAGGGNTEPLNEDPNFNFAWDHGLAPYVTSAAHEGTTNTWYTAHAGALAAATWYHLSATYDGTSLCMYVDGQAAGPCTLASTPLPPSGPLLIGSATSVQASFTGMIDEVRLYDVAQTPARIDAEYASQRADEANPFVTFGATEVVP
ncbi:MAG TPA: DUF2341 domain-containing protein [Kofleriaceae bacterium]|jgi:hypothetical protein